MTGPDGFLVLEDGAVFRGTSVAADGVAFGEAVFTTGMTGYQEVATDPSFAEQIVCFTAPMIGNYGIDPARSESERIHAKAVLMREARGPEWPAWLRASGVVALSGVDTRSLVLHLRDRGAMRAAAASRGDPEQVLAQVREQPSMTGRSLVAGVSCREPWVFTDEGDVGVAVVDYGLKRSILRRLAKAGARVAVYPHDVDADTLARHDGVLLANGPGDPEPLEAEAAVVREALGRVPIFGICLGHQVLALATDHPTFKLPFGHRGSNHPVLDRQTGRVMVTTQNHGFAVEAADDPAVTHVSLYDGTVEGLSFPELRARTMQFHPEAGPGPHDAWPAIEGWVESLRAA
jgi:carbamoyl-phosphate synthase small subunit